MHVTPMAMQSPMGQTQPGMSIQVQGNNAQMGHNMGAYAQSPGMQPQGQQYVSNSGQQNWYGQNPQPGYYPPMPGKPIKVITNMRLT